MGLDARKGMVRSALRIGEFTLARRTASTLSQDADAWVLDTGAERTGVSPVIYWAI